MIRMALFVKYPPADRGLGITGLMDIVDYYETNSTNDMTVGLLTIYRTNQYY